MRVIVGCSSARQFRVCPLDSWDCSPCPPSPPRAVRSTLFSCPSAGPCVLLEMGDGSAGVGTTPFLAQDGISKGGDP